MFRRTDDLRIRDVRPLIPPAILLEEIPITERASDAGRELPAPTESAPASDKAAGFTPTNESSRN